MTQLEFQEYMKAQVHDIKIYIEWKALEGIEQDVAERDWVTIYAEQFRIEWNKSKR